MEGSNICGLEEDKENSKLQAIELEKQLVADCAALEAQEFSVFNAEVIHSPKLFKLYVNNSIKY